MSAHSDSAGWIDAELRAQDRNEWLASLFAPPAHRPAVQALRLFGHEVARIPLIVSEPLLGDIRLQWWREVLSGERGAEAASSPLATALLDAMARNRWPADALVRVLDARRFDLYHDAMPSLAALEGYCGDVYGAPLRLASIALAGGVDPGGAAACGHGGMALGVAALLSALPLHAARGRCFLPLDVLARHGAVEEAARAGLISPALLGAIAQLRTLARTHLGQARREAAAMREEARIALAPLAFVEPMLRRMERPGFDPFRDDASLPQWRAQWALWRWRL